MIIILDFGSKFVNKIQEMITNMYNRVTILDYSTSFDKIKNLEPIGIILSGGPGHVYMANSPKISLDILNSGIPIFGICYGMQLIGFTFGGIVKRMNKTVHGSSNVQLINSSDIFENVKNNDLAEMRHIDYVSVLPKDFISLASTEYCTAAMRHEYKHIYGVQFHPEITNTSMSLVVNNFINLCFNLKKNS